MAHVSREKHEELEAFWRFHHDEWARGMLNQRAYCELHGLPLKQFGKA
ncbi:IS66 family insertion sequence element accessory protein TnpA [Aquisediminimonas sediminicola]